MDVQWTCSGSVVELQGICGGGAVEVEVEVEVKVEVKVKSALRASLCGGSPRVEDPAILFIEF